jgi:PhnB protein
MNLYTHLNFGGNCENAFRFYEKHLGGTITVIMKQSQMMPRQSAEQAGNKDGVVHARMSVSGVELIGNDVPADRFLPMRSCYLYLALDSTEDAERVYGVLAEEGQVSMPIAETPFASRFAQLRDRFGVLWTIIHQRPRAN